MLKARALTPFVVALAITACTDHTTNPVDQADGLVQSVRKPGPPGAASDRMLFQVLLAAAEGSRSRGVMRSRSSEGT